MSDNLLWMQNPELAQAMRRQRMGQQLMQQGTDTSPIQSPWQGVARLAQALVGGYEARKGREEVTGAGERRKAELAAIMGGGMPPAQPAMPSPAPSAMPAPAPPSGVSPELIGMATPIAQKYGVPLNVALGLVLQESGGNPGAVGDGGQSVGLGQIKDTTAMQPGYGVPAMDPAKRGDPAANLDFSLNYLTSKARHLGFGDLSNPENVDRALAAYNGGGDPNYVQNVRSRMPTDMATPVAGPQGQPQQNTPQFHMDRAQRLQAAGFQQEAAMEMQRAQLAAQMAKQPAETEAHRLAVAAGLQPGSPEYQQMMRSILERKGAPPVTNVTVGGNTSVGTITPGYQLVRDGENYRMEPIPGGPADRDITKEREAAANKKEGEIRKSNIVIEDIDRVFKLMDESFLPVTGLGAGLAGKIPGTGSADVDKLLVGIKANIGFDTLNKMRSESVTGAALGSITEKELAYLQSVLGSLDQSQSPEQFRTTLKRVRELFLETIHGPRWREVSPGMGDATPMSGPGGDDMPTVNDPADAAKLPPGTRFRAPDGRILQVPTR